MFKCHLGNDTAGARPQPADMYQYMTHIRTKQGFQAGARSHFRSHPKWEHALVRKPKRTMQNLPVFELFACQIRSQTKIGFGLGTCARFVFRCDHKWTHVHVSICNSWHVRDVLTAVISRVLINQYTTMARTGFVYMFMSGPVAGLFFDFSART